MPDPGGSDLSWLRLSRSRNVGPATFARLMARFGSADAALEALPALAKTGGGGGAYQVCSAEQAEREFAAAEQSGARFVRLDRPDYPRALATIGDPPPFLWMHGDQGLTTRPALAIVGARNASANGLRMARMLAQELGEAGYVIVSGLARGVDAEAHRAALPTGTIAVLAGGVDHIYPKENTALAGQIAEQGLRLSEAPPGLVPQARHFPRRNRIISGLARAVILVETAERSGSLITARQALEQGREVMAVPGGPLDARSAGGNLMIRQGAALIRGARDVIEALEGPLVPGLHDSAAAVFDPRPAPPPAPETDATAICAEITRLLSDSPVEEDEIARRLDVPQPLLAQAFLQLELAGRLDRRAGGLVALIPD